MPELLGLMRLNGARPRTCLTIVLGFVSFVQNLGFVWTNGALIFVFVLCLYKLSKRLRLWPPSATISLLLPPWVTQAVVIQGNDFCLIRVSSFACV